MDLGTGLHLGDVLDWRLWC